MYRSWRCTYSFLSVSQTDILLQASQRLSDSWRSVFGSCAIVILNAFFEDHDQYRDSDNMRQEFARHSLDLLRFSYRKAKGNDRRVSFPTYDKLR